MRADNRGALNVSYVDDTSNTYTTGATGFAENGPPVVSRQIHGISLIKGKGNRTGYIKSAGKGPGAPMNKIKDAKGDDFYSANGALTSAGPAVDLRAASVTQKTIKKKAYLVFHMKAQSLKSLSVPATAGGTTATWITRFTTYDPHTLGNGHIYYAGMESTEGGAPTFFDGDTSPPTQQVQLSMDFTSGHAVKGYVSHKKGTITILAPRKDFPGITRQHRRLYSVTAFTGTTAAPLPTSATGTTGISNEINQTDATAPFDVKAHYKKIKKHTPKTTKSFAAGPSPLAPIVAGGFGLLGVLLLGAGAALSLRRRGVTASGALAR